MQDEEETTEEAPEAPETPEPEGVEEEAPKEHGPEYKLGFSHSHVFEEAPADDDVPADPEPVPEAPVAQAQADGDPEPVEPFNQPSFAEHQAAKQAALRAQRNG